MLHDLIATQTQVPFIHSASKESPAEGRGEDKKVGEDGEFPPYS